MSDLIPRKSVEYICRKEVVSTNPDDFAASEKFIQFMDNPEIASFGRWQHANGFNTGLIAVQCGLEKVPSVQDGIDINVGSKSVPSSQVDIVPVVRCKDCKWYGRADKRRFYRGMDCLQKRIDTIIPDKDFCSRAERREE